MLSVPSFAIKGSKSLTTSAHDFVQTGSSSHPVRTSHDTPQAKWRNPRDGLVTGERDTIEDRGPATKRTRYRRLTKNSSIRYDQKLSNKLNVASNHHATWLTKFTFFNSAPNGPRKKRISSGEDTALSTKYATTDHNQDATLYHILQDVPPREEPCINAPTPKDP